jgi:hypothetical protein
MKTLAAIVVLAALALTTVAQAEPGTTLPAISLGQFATQQAPAQDSFSIAALATKPFVSGALNDFAGGFSFQAAKLPDKWGIIGGHYANIDALASTAVASRYYLGLSLSVSKTANNWIVGIKAIGGGPLTLYSGWRTELTSW